MTIRQKRRARIMGKNGTTQAELLEAGYAPSTAKKQPKTVMKAKGWLKLMDQYLPDEHLVTKHQEFLDAKKVTRTFIKGQQTEVEESIDPTAIRALDLAYKVKGKYSEVPNSLTQINVDKGNSITFVNFKNDTKS